MDYSTRRTLLEGFADLTGLNFLFHRPCDDEVDPDESVFASPVEARLVHVGRIEKGGSLISKLGRRIDLGEVIEGLDLFSGGFYMNFYLSPKDKHYWRIPYDSELISIKVNNGKAKIPVIVGLEKFFPRTDFFEKAIKKNATIGSVFKTKKFDYAMIAVGSLNVNSIHTVGKGFFKKGEIGGYFSLGSSMLLCFPESSGVKSLVELGAKVDIGERILKLP